MARYILALFLLVMLALVVGTQGASTGRQCVESDLSIVRFLLYNHLGDKNSFEEMDMNDISGDSGSYIPELPLNVLIPGFGDKGNDPAAFPTNVKDAYMDAQKGSLNRNVLVVSLGSMTSTKEGSVQPRDLVCYLEAVKNTNMIGEHIADFLEFLIKEGKTSPGRIHLLGDNLGAHIAGYVGSEIFKRFSTKIHRITAIDPAIRGFITDEKTNARMLSANDAGFVDAIVSAYQLAWGEIGHVDFFFLQQTHGDLSYLLGGSKAESDLPLGDNYASLLYAKSIGRSDMMGTFDGKSILFGENCDSTTRGTFMVCFNVKEDKPCSDYSDRVHQEESEEIFGKAPFKGGSSH